MQQLNNEDLEITKNYSNAEIITYIIENCIPERNKSKKLFELLHNFFEYKRDSFVDNMPIPDYLDTYNVKNFKTVLTKWKKEDNDKDGRAIPEKVKQAISQIFNLPYKLWKIDKTYTQNIQPIYSYSEGKKLRAIVQFYYKDDKKAFFNDFHDYILEHYELAKYEFVKPESASKRQKFFEESEYTNHTKEALRRFVLKLAEVDFLDVNDTYIDQILKINSIEYHLSEAESYLKLGLHARVKCISENAIKSEEFYGDPKLCIFFKYLFQIECKNNININPKCLEYIDQHNKCKNINSFTTGYFDNLLKGRLSIDIDFGTSLKYTLRAIELQPTLLFAYNNLRSILVANNQNIEVYKELLDDQFGYFFKKKNYNKEALIFDDLIKIVYKIKKKDFLNNITKLTDELNSWHSEYKETKIGKYVLPDYTIGVEDNDIKFQILFLMKTVKDMRIELRTNSDLKTLISLYKN